MEMELIRDKSTQTWGMSYLNNEFSAKILIVSVFLTCKWCPTFMWYTQLQRVAKIRRFTIIARRSIANLANIPGRIGRSLDDECLGIAIIRRGKYASLLGLDRLSEESSNRAKSLTTLVTDDTSDANDYNSDVNDLSVAEKSMRMLNVTAEDVMDARARIQERSYWNERVDVITETPKKEIITHFPFEKNEKEMMTASRNKQPAKDDLKKVVDHTLRKEDIIGYLPRKKEEKKDNDKIVLIDGKEQIFTGDQDVSLVKSKDVTFDKVDDHAKSESSDVYVAPKKKRKETKEEVARMVQCPSDQNARNMETKPCASLVRKLEAKLYPIPVNQQEKWIDRVDRRRHPCQIDTQLTPTSNASRKKTIKEYYKNSKTACACHRALRNASKNEKHARLIDIDGMVEYSNRKEFRSFTPIVNMQRSRIDKSTFKYSEAYRLKKQIQKYEECRRKQSWGSKSLAQTARPSGYAKNVIDASDKLFLCRKSVQTETYDESNDFLSARYRLRHKQMRNRRLVDLRSVYNIASFREKNYAEAHETKMKALETYDNFTLGKKEETKMRKEHNLLPANRKLSIENREAIELRALRAYNELTLLEDKRELEVRKERDSSLNHERLTKKSEVPEMKVSKTNNGLTLSEDIEETERTSGHNLSPSSQQSVDERSSSRVRNELTQSGSKRELQTRRKRDSSRVETPLECEEDVEIPTRVSNCLSIGSYEDTTISTRRNANSSSGLNNRYARQAHMSLNLREITRNIEWTVHPRGIILTNENLHGQFLVNGRFRESRERDIVDDNTASMLHSAFFFKPEIVTRVFRRAQTRIGESFPSFPTFRREDFNPEFVCRMNNEMIVCNRNSLSDCDLERMMGNDRSNLGDSMLANANRGVGNEHGHDLCIKFIDREQIPSETAIMENSTTVGSQEDAHSSIESTRTMNILVFDEDHDRVDNATNVNLSLRLITNVLRNFDMEMSEGNIRDVALPIEEDIDVSNVNIHNNSQRREFNTDDISPDEENNNECDRISSHKNADVDDTFHENEQILNSSDNRLDNVTSYISSLEKLNNSRDKKYLSTTDIHSKNEICENKLFLKNTDNNTNSQLSDNNNNKQFDILDNKLEKSMLNHVFKNSSKLSFPGPSSFIESNNCHASRSSDEKLQKLTQLSDSATTLNDQKKELVSNLKDTNYNTIPQFQNVKTLKLESRIQDDARSKNENKDVYEESNEFLAEKFFKMHSDDQLQQDDSFYFTYERNDDSGTPVSLEEGSLMEEFLNDPIPPGTSLNSSYS